MIVSERLIFKKPDQQDFQRFYEINADPKHNLFNPYGVMDYDIAINVFKKTLKHWEDNTFGIWKIYNKQNINHIIGFGGLSNRYYEDTLRLNLGFRFDKLYWGKGYATELANTAVKYGFNVLNKTTIFGLVRPQNLASIKVLKKCGMICFDKLSDVPNEEDSLIFKIEKESYSNNKHTQYHFQF